MASRMMPILSMFVVFLSMGATAEQTQFKLAEGQLAEGHVVLSRVHPVIADNFPSITDKDAPALIQTHESRVPHYHVMRLRDAHGNIRTVKALGNSLASLAQPSHPTWFSDLFGSFGQFVGHLSGQPHTPGKWFTDLFGSMNEKLTGIASSHSETHPQSTSSSIRMTNLRDSQYVGPLQVGSQKDILSVVYDTGSTNLWFASTLCTEGPCLRRRRYDPWSSNSYREGDYDLHVTFGTGELSGQQGIDDVEMGGFTVKQQTFAMIQVEKGSIFDQLDFEGILGLAFPSMSANGVPPFFDQVMEQKLLQNNAVSFYFTKLPTDASAVFFGNVDPRLHDGELASFPVTEEYYWMVDLKDFKIGGRKIDGPNKVVFDTGTTYYTAPKALLSTVLAEMPQTECAAVRDGTSELPDMSFTLLGLKGKEHEIVIKPSEYMVGSGQDELCDPAWMPIEVPSPHGPAWIFGEAFMRTYFTSFQRGDGDAELSVVKIARQNPDSIGLVQQLKKDSGMSANQKKLSLMSQSEVDMKLESAFNQEGFLGGTSVMQAESDIVIKAEGDMEEGPKTMKSFRPHKAW